MPPGATRRGRAVADFRDSCSSPVRTVTASSASRRHTATLTREKYGAATFALHRDTPLRTGPEVVHRHPVKLRRRAPSQTPKPAPCHGDRPPTRRASSTPPTIGRGLHHCAASARGNPRRSSAAPDPLAVAAPTPTGSARARVVRSNRRAAPAAESWPTQRRRRSWPGCPGCCGPRCSARGPRRWRSRTRSGCRLGRSGPPSAAVAS